MKVLIFVVLVAVIPSVDPIYSNVLNVLLRIIKNKGDEIVDIAVGNNRCSRDLKVVLRDLIRRKLWAIEMLDASGKINSGLFHGNVFISGNFDQCLNIHEEKNDTIIDGQYCTVILQPSSQYSNEVTDLLDMITAVNYLQMRVEPQAQQIIKLFRVTFGLCMPTSCTIGNLQTLWNYLEHTFRVPLHIDFVDSLCRSRNQLVQPYSVDSYITTAFAVYAFILVLATLYDILIYQSLEAKDNKQGNYFTAFSLYSNTKKLFSYNYQPGEGIGLKCLSGIKVISMLWIVYGHRTLIDVFAPNINSKYVFEWWKNMENAPMLATTFTVDTFFLLSGLLLSYVCLKNQHLFGEKGLPVLLFYVYRIFRISPALLATILFYIGIFKNLGDGPVWPLITMKFSRCCHHFWSYTLFFTSNWLPMQYQCLEQSWFLSVDTQLYFISPIILKNLPKYPKKTIAVCLIVCMVSAVYSFIITIENRYGSMFYHADKEYYQYIYFPTFVRMPSWLIGIILGYLTFKYQQISIPKGLTLIAWFLSLSTMVFIILMHVVFARYSYDPVRSAIFNSCARPSWAAAVGAVVFLCVTGHGGIIDTFLSLPIFQILVRLTYSMYLVHIAVLMYLVGQKKTPGYFSNLNSFHDFVGDLFFTFIVATVWCLAFETPFLNISKILIQKELISFFVVYRFFKIVNSRYIRAGSKEATSEERYFFKEEIK